MIDEENINCYSSWLCLRVGTRLTIDKAANFFALAGTQIGRLVEAGAFLYESLDDLESEGFGELALFGQRCLELGIADIR